MERAVGRLKQSDTGLELYTELDAIKEVIVINTAHLAERQEGIVLGETIVEGDVEKNKFKGAAVKIDPKNIEKDAVQWGRESPKDAPAITVGHEFGHVKAAKDDLKKYVKEAKASREVYDQQALPYEKAIREELTKPEEEKEQ